MRRGRLIRQVAGRVAGARPRCVSQRAGSPLRRVAPRCASLNAVDDLQDVALDEWSPVGLDTAIEMGCPCAWRRQTAVASTRAWPNSASFSSARRPWRRETHNAARLGRASSHLLRSAPTDMQQKEIEHSQLVLLSQLKWPTLMPFELR